MALASDGNGNWLSLGQDGQWTPATRARNPETGAELVLDGAEWKPLPDAAGAQRSADARRANSGVGGFVDSLGRTLAQGASFGFADEIAAGGDALLGHLAGRGSQASGIGARYSENLANERARDSTFREDNPVAATVGNLVGAVAMPGGMGAGLIRGSGVGAAAGRGVVAGTTGGAAGGFGEGEGGLGNRLESAALGGGLGAAGGAALGLGANVGSRVGGRLLDVAGLRNPETAADRQILRALERDNRPLADVATEAAAPQGGAPLALADLGGRNTTSLAAVAANVPGRSMEAADAFVQGRRAAGPDRIAAASDAAFGGGSGDDVAAQVEALGRRRSADAAPLYERAFERRVPETVQERIDPLVASREGQTALNHAVTIMEREGRAAHLRSGDQADLFDPAAMGLTRAEDGGWMLEGRMQNMRLVDAIKRGMDEMLEAHRDPVTLRLPNTQAVRALDDQRRAYVEYLRGHPHLQPYAQALDAWAGPSRALDAVNQGRTALTRDRDVVGGIAERMSPGDQDFLRLGAGRQLTDMASDPAKAPGVARRLLEDRQMQARLQSLLPPDRNAALAEALRGEVRVNAGNAAYSPRAGSQTARLQAGMDDMGADPPGGMVMALLNATQRGGITGAGARGLEMLYRRGQGINSSTADALAQRLFSSDPQRNAEVIRALTQRQASDTSNLEARRALIARLLQGAGTTAGITAN